jgi:hypothetical protein
MSYSARSVTWEHGVILNNYAGSGTLKNGDALLVTSACDYFTTTCTATVTSGSPDTQLVAITPVVTVAKTWAETDTGSAPALTGGVDYLDPFIGTVFFLTAPTTEQPPIVLVHDLGDLGGRCDSAAVTGSAGCVDQYYTPTLSLSLAQYGAGAAMVQWAQVSLSPHWGLQGVGQPLTRLVNQGNNRQIICDSTFANQGSAIGGNDGDSDSCDEFPFAATYQSGALNGVTSGAQCAQLTAVQTGNSGNEAADWASVTPVGTVTGSEVCARSHNPLNLNTDVGGAYGRFIISQRLIDQDPFWVVVTP